MGQSYVRNINPTAGNSQAYHSKDVKVYPSLLRSGESFTIEIPKSEEVTVQVMNSTGSIVYSQITTGKAIQIRERLATGMYVILLHGEKGGYMSEVVFY